MPKGFFRAIWRFNALTIAAVSALGLFIGSYAAFQIARDVFYRPYQAHDIARVEPQDGTTGPGTPAPKIRTDLSVNRFSHIRGTDTVWAQLSATQSYDYKYSSKEASSTRNVIFYDLKTGQSRKLLPDDDRIVIETNELRDDDPQALKPPKALLFSLIEKDTNADGVLNTEDGVTIVLTRPNGEGLTRIEEARGSFKGEMLVSGSDNLVLMFEKDGQIKALHISLSSFKVTNTEPVAR